MYIQSVCSNFPVKLGDCSRVWFPGDGSPFFFGISWNLMSTDVWDAGSITGVVDFIQLHTCLKELNFECKPSKARFWQAKISERFANFPCFIYPDKFTKGLERNQVPCWV